MTARDIKTCVKYDRLTGDLTRLTIDRCYITKLNLQNGNSYWRLTLDGKYYLGHRVAWYLATGEWPTHLIDHKNGNGLDNRWENLRHTTNTGNGLNIGATGVSWHKTRKYWITHITYKGKQLYLGKFYDYNQAVACVNTKREELIIRESNSIL